MRYYLTQVKGRLGINMVPLHLTKVEALTQTEGPMEDLFQERPMHQGFAALEAALVPKLTLKTSLEHLQAEQGGEGRLVNLLSMKRH